MVVWFSSGNTEPGSIAPLVVVPEGRGATYSFGRAGEQTESGLKRADNLVNRDDAIAGKTHLLLLAFGRI